MVSQKMIEEFENLKKENLDFVILIKRGIFYYLLQEQAEKLAAPLNLKLRAVTENMPLGEAKTVTSCGFPNAGLDKYIGKLVRLGKNIVIFEDGKISEKICLKAGKKND